MKEIEKNLNKYYRKNETELVKELIEYLSDLKFIIPSVEQEAFETSEKIQNKSQNRLKVENLMNMYPLYSTKGRNMMGLSEALLRIPDSYNQEKLIIEKIKGNNWCVSKSYGVFLYTLSVAMNLGAKLLPKNHNGIIKKTINKIARLFARKIIEVISYQFILSQNINQALAKSKELIKKGYSFSYDMLGESARTDLDAKMYFEQYKQAIISTGEFSKTTPNKDDVSISIKLSSLHCRYEVSKYSVVKEVLYKRLLELCKLAKQYDLLLFIDAEEAERLVMSLTMLDSLLGEKDLEGWQGFGLAVQCYQKRGFYTIDEVAKLANKYGKKLYVRLVKGAYWDAEIKADQVNGVEDFSLFTRKEHTDIAYMACVKKMAFYEKEIYPCFATHNAFSIAYVRKIMGAKPYEFQCLQGMGDIVYDDLIKNDKTIKVRKYAPVGVFNHLLPYLVRRLIENGAKNSFINQILAKGANIREIVKNPIILSNKLGNSRHDLIKLPREIFSSENRINSKGKDMAHMEVWNELQNAVDDNIKNTKYEVYSIVNGEDVKSEEKEDIINPANLSDKLGFVNRSNKDTMLRALDVAHNYFPIWNNTEVSKRAEILETVANQLENKTTEFVAILVREAGKSIKDSVLEVREAVDFLRYYAYRAKEEFACELVLPGPIGEKNTLKMEGRGVFLCIAPWNFPLAIFLGQIAAALAAGNTVIAKPAESTQAIGYECVKLMLACGMPKEAIQFLPAKGKVVGEVLLENPKLGGVAFTGSDVTAKNINRSLANRSGAIIPFIAETGGQNAMIVDSTALKEQVTRDVLSSAFQSAGQRCSALRVLFVQEEIADDLIHMIQHAALELKIGEPKFIDNDVGPVINNDALVKLQTHMDYISKNAKVIKQLDVSKNLNGYFFGPAICEINKISDLKSEVFGPILHVLRFNIANIGKLVEEVNSTGYGLTFAIHSRLDSNIKLFSNLIRAGNIYINRNQIGAVVSSQPFGGMGNSGTGPKAGGPLYLHKFAVEKTISEDLTASGGDIEIMSKV